MNKPNVPFYAVLAFLLCLALFEHLGARYNYSQLEAKVTHLRKDLEKAEREIIQHKLNNPTLEERLWAKENVIGFKNNNPGNIKGTGWFGQIGVDKAGHAIFENEAHGIRAIARVLLKFEEAGINTVQKIVAKYAQGNTEAYSAFLCNRLQVKADEKLNIKERMHELVPAIIHFECGSNPYPPEYFMLLSWPASL